MQEMRYAVGKYCCARLQLYHALMHYKHRLRGKLKKRIKREHSVTQVSRFTVSQLYPGFLYDIDESEILNILV